MKNRQTKKLIILPSSTHSFFVSLSNEINWCKILLKEYDNRQYSKFLEWLIDQEFFQKYEEKTTIKKMASQFGERPEKLTRWLHQMYDDIFEINDSSPELFKVGALKAHLIFKNYDAHGSLNLDILPREYEGVYFPFMNARVGTANFYVKQVIHQYENGKAEVDIWLEGGFVNKYREWLRERAVFHGYISWMEDRSLQDFEIR